MQRLDIRIPAEGATLAGWLCLPDDFTGPLPAVVMSHGFSAVKEMFLDDYARVFTDAGLAAIVFDHRGFGASDGTPRQEIDPVRQVRDTRDAITWATQQPQVDAQRIGVWGSSYSGGHALVLGAIDRRVRCVAVQAPLISGPDNVQRLVRSDVLPGLRAMCDADRAARFSGAEPARIPVVSDDPAVPCAFPTSDSWQWFSRSAAERAPAWRNEITLRSFEMLMEYEPGSWIARISPTPLLMVVARDDQLAVSDLALAAYERALEPKRLVLLPGGHFDVYGPQFAASSAAARDWFVQNLGG